jgi:succinate-semialdehyde dehydrogenase / glutarate-semialdehyde dehydrogenase
MPFKTINPATGEVLAVYESMNQAEVEAAIGAAQTAFESWRETELDDRADLLRALSARLGEGRDELAWLMTREMGKPLAEAKAEIEKCAWVCDYYADHGGHFLRKEIVGTDAAKSYVTFQPIGIVLGIMPWNYPFWQVIRFTAPCTMAGNAVLLKHAENVTGCALALERLLRDAGFPEHLFRTALVEVDRVGAMIEDNRIKAVTLTGSTRAGRAVAAQAGARIKKTVLELGGNDPYVVLEDADLDLAAESCVTSRMLNSGQSCIAAKRWIVVASVLEDFQARVVELMSRAVMGDPTAGETTLGPLAREDLRDNLHRQVSESLAAGARCVIGGSVPDRPGWFYPATVLTGVGPGMPAYDEELFGPVASILRAEDEDDALRIANDTAYGLGAAVFTEDRERGERIASEVLQAGACFVNGFVKSDPRLPFGGVKESGYGRELSPFGIREFVNVKTVWIA